MGYLWKHCVRGHELTHPTLEDRLVGVVTCPTCGVEEKVDTDERRLGVQELLDKIDRIDAKDARFR